MTVDLEAVHHVKMLAVTQRERGNLEGHLVGSEFRVGNSTTFTDNPSCGVTVNEAGLYDCDLWGRYATLRRFRYVSAVYNVAEIAVWPQKNICPLGEAS